MSLISSSISKLITLNSTAWTALLSIQFFGMLFHKSPPVSGNFQTDPKIDYDIKIRNTSRTEKKCKRKISVHCWKPEQDRIAFESADVIWLKDRRLLSATSLNKRKTVCAERAFTDATVSFKVSFQILWEKKVKMDIFQGVNGSATDWSKGRLSWSGWWFSLWTKRVWRWLGSLSDGLNRPTSAIFAFSTAMSKLKPSPSWHSHGPIVQRRTLPSPSSHKGSVPILCENLHRDKQFAYSQLLLYRTGWD